MHADNFSACSFSRFCMGMCGCPGGYNARPRPNGQSSPRRPSEDAPQQLTLPPLNEPSVQRYEFVSDEKLAELAKGLVPPNTARNTRWALRTISVTRVVAGRRPAG